MMNEQESEDLITQTSDDQYLTFAIGRESYGIKILSVQEIRGWEPVARVPNTPAYVKGVLNLRGTAVPILDMRMRMGEKAPEYNSTTVVVILRTVLKGRQRIAGIVVDSVSDVMNATSEEIRKTPDFGESVDTEFIQGLVDVGGNMVMLFNVDGFMKHPDIYDDPESIETITTGT